MKKDWRKDQWWDSIGRWRFVCNEGSSRKLHQPSLFQKGFIFHPLLFLSICFLYFRRSPFVAKAVIHRTLSVSPLTHENNFALSYEGWVLSEKILMKIHDSLSQRWLPQQDSAVRVDSFPWQCRLAKVQQWDHQWLWAGQPCTVASINQTQCSLGNILLSVQIARICWVWDSVGEIFDSKLQLHTEPAVLVDQAQMWTQVAQISEDTSDYSG